MSLHARTAAMSKLPVYLLAAGLLAATAFALEDPEGSHPPVRVAGLNAVSKPVSLAVPILNSRGIKTKLTPENSSASAINDVGAGKQDIALAVRPLNAADRANYPHKSFMDTLIGFQVLVMGVPRDVWEGGVHSLTREQLQGIYEGRIRNWKEVGGKEEPIKFYNHQPGHGIWEFFATWLYGEIRKAPLGEKFEVVHDNEEARDLVELNDGSIAAMSPSFANDRSVHALSISDGGEPVAPTAENIHNETYPFERPLLMITADKAAGDLRKVIEFMSSPQGQELVTKSQFVPAKPPKP